MVFSTGGHSVSVIVPLGKVFVAVLGREVVVGLGVVVSGGLVLDDVVGADVVVVGGGVVLDDVMGADVVVVGGGVVLDDVAGADVVVVGGGVVLDDVIGAAELELVSTTLDVVL